MMDRFPAGSFTRNLAIWTVNLTATMRQSTIWF